MIIVAALSIGTAWLLFKFVETKFRKPWTKDPETEKYAVPAGVLAFAMGVMVVCIYPWVQNGWAWRVSQDKQKIVLATAKSEKLKRNLRALKGMKKQCFFGVKSSTADFVLIGDSHASALALGLAPLAIKQGKTGVRMTKTGTLPFRGGRTFDNGKNSGRNFDPHFRWILERGDPEVVILHGRFAQNWETRNPSVQQQNTTKYNGIDGKPVPTNTTASQDYFKELLDTTIRDLKNSGKTVVLVGAIPYQGVNLAQCINRPNWLMSLNHSIESCGGFSRDNSLNRMAEVNVVLKDAAERADIIWVDPTPTFCPEDEANCLRILDGKLVYRDDDHLNNFGAGILAELVFEKLGWQGKKAAPVHGV